MPWVPHTQATDGDDMLLGTAVGEYIAGRRGNDRIHGGDGADWIQGDSADGPLPGDGPGNNLINAGPGLDVVIGGFGIDTIYGGAGNDFLYGFGGNRHDSVPPDVLAADPGNVIYGGLGNDFISSGGGADFLDGGNGNDGIRGGGGPDYLLGGPGRDSFQGVFTTTTPELRPTIADFQHGLDTIFVPTGTVYQGLEEFNPDLGVSQVRYYSANDGLGTVVAQFWGWDFPTHTHFVRGEVIVLGAWYLAPSDFGL